MFCSEETMLGTSKSIWEFNPRSIPGLSIWFDAADKNTLTLSGTNITAWTSKGSIPIVAWPASSGAGTPVGGGTNSNASGGFMTSGASVNGNNAVNCPAQTTYGMNSTITFPAQARAVFGVYQVNTAGAVPYVTFFGCSTVNPNAQNGMNNFIYYDGQQASLFSETGAAASNILQALPAPGTFATGSPHIVALVQSATSTASNVITLDGNSQTKTTDTIASTYSTAAQYYFIGASYNSSYILCEYLMFNAEITTAQRQAMEGYLSKKWGRALQSGHPYFTTRPFNKYFLPTDLSGCSVWLDAADSGNMNSTTTVTSWKDRTGVYTFTGTATWTGSNMTFNGSSQAFSNTSYVVPTAAYSMFAVYSNTTAPASTAYMNVMYGNGGFPMIGVYDVNKYVSVRPVSGVVGALVTNVAASSNVLVSTRYPSAASTTAPFINGTAKTTLGGGTTAATGIYVGGPTNYFNGSISELIIYNVTLSDPQRQQVEGYLIQKWGLSAQIDATHVYKNIPPAVVVP